MESVGIHERKRDGKKDTARDGEGLKLTVGIMWLFMHVHGTE